MSTPVSIQVTRIIKEGQEEAFESALRDFFQKIQPIPGQLSVHVVRPVKGSGSREWGILRTFADQQAREAFFDSDIYQEYNARVAEYTEGETRIENLCGLETWFTVPGHRAVIPPPRWKMALVTFLGVYLTSNLMGWLLAPWLHGLPELLTSAVLVAATVIGLTWFVMPLLSRLFRPWLQAGNSPIAQRKPVV